MKSKLNWVHVFVVLGLCSLGYTNDVRGEISEMQTTDQTTSEGTKASKEIVNTSSDNKASTTKVKVEIPEPYAIDRLPNGLQVFYFQNNLVPKVSVGVFYMVGTGDDPSDQVGLSHFLEHLMFQGNAKSFKEKLAEIGGIINANTGWDRTVYVNNVASNHLETVLKMEAHRMRHLTFDAPQIETERQVVLAERLMRLDSHPYGKMIEAIFRTRFWYHPYGVTPIGFPHHIQKYSLESCKKHYETYYRPDNAILIILGDFDSTIKDKVKDIFGPLSNPSVPLPKREWAQEPDHSGIEQHIRFTSKRVASRMLALSYEATQGLDKPEDRALALSLFANILGGGKKGHLYQYLVNEKKVALNVACSMDKDQLGPQDFNVTIELAPGAKEEDVEKLFNDFLKAYLDKGISEKELSETQQAMAAKIDFLADSDELLELVGETVVLGKTFDDLKKELAKMQTISKNEVMDHARSVLSKPPVLVLHVYPEK